MSVYSICSGPLLMKAHRSVALVRWRRASREARLLRQPLDPRWFALTDLCLVILSGIAWMVIPAFGLWFTLLALLPWGLRLLDKAPPYRRTPLDGAIVIFLVTTWTGYWASYDKSTAWVKAWLIMTTILLYFALSAQPKRNLGLLSFLSFALGLGVY